MNAIGTLNALALFAQGGIVDAVGTWVIVAIAVAAIIGIGLVAVRLSGWNPPPAFVQIAWIILGAILCILAVVFLLAMLHRLGVA